MRRLHLMRRMAVQIGVLALLAGLLPLPGAFSAWGQEDAAGSASVTAAPAPAPAGAQAAEPPPPTYSQSETEYALDNMMLFLTAVLVLFMQAGFALVETGLNASKNAVNIMMKNFMDLVVGVLLFFVVGYGMMYPGESIYLKVGEAKVWGFGQFGISEEADPAKAGNLHSQADFLFQCAFCATAATIVSGCVAGRIQFRAYLIYTAVITGLIYPVSGMWKWGQGWLHQLGFMDFAGSVVVHAVGGFAGLAGALALGPRLGRFVKGKSIPMPGHNIPFAALGVFILWIGWYGFNPGSQLAFTGKVNTDAVVLIAVNTTLAAAGAAMVAMLLSWMLFKKPDLTMALNGALGGLVGITANCDCVSNWEALLYIGPVAGVLVTLAVVALDKLQIDDPVGAFPVHGVCGVWGGIATGLFGTDRALVPQLIGTFTIVGWSLATSLALFYGLKAAGLLRVSAEEELAGLDISEHGMYAYPQPQVALESFGGGTPLGSAFGPSVLAPAKPSAVEAV